MPNPAAVKSPPPAPPAAPQAFKIVPTPRERGAIEEPSAENAWATSWTHQQRETFATLMSITASAEIPGFGLVHRVAAECQRCNRAMTRYLREANGSTSAHELCDACTFAEMVATTRAEQGGLATITADSLDWVAQEKRDLAARFPSLHAAMAEAGTLPDDRPHDQGGAVLKWNVAYVVVPSAERLVLDAFAPLKSGRFGAGDFGDVGRLADARLDDAGRFYVDMLDQLHKNALAIELGFGLIRGRYEASRQEREAHELRHARPLLAGTSFGAPPRPVIPNLYAEVVGLLDRGQVVAICRPHVSHDRE